MCAISSNLTALTHSSPLTPCRNHDGKVTLEEFIAFADLCKERSKLYQSYECAAQLQAFCSLRLWRAMSSPNGLEQFTDW